MEGGVAPPSNNRGGRGGGVLGCFVGVVGGRGGFVVVFFGVGCCGSPHGMEETQLPTNAVKR